MKILIVDDDQSKIDVIKRQILKINSDIGNTDIHEASNASEARILLSRNSFDIMFLDVLLPARLGEVPRGDVSIELLRQIIDDGTSNAPNHIIGITACSIALEDHRSKFTGLASQILLVSPETDDWKCSIYSLFSLLRNAKAAEHLYDYDICVLTALRTPELDAVISEWKALLEPEELIAENLLVTKATLRMSGVDKRIVFAHLSQMGLVSAVHATEALIQRYKPRLFFMTGICGGFSDKVNIGDVIVADKSWDWQAGKWDRNGKLLTALDQKEADQKLLALSRSIGDNLKELNVNETANIAFEKQRLHIGPMVSGSSVIASIDIQQIFRNQHRKMVAVDMECYGVYYAAAMTGGPKPQVLCVKSVSDLADADKGDDSQKYCSEISARVALNIAIQALV
tara:strand:- start:176342 stop:177538 length:1197 start_codon:yes stop_codon:yes gene_type:complete